MAHGVPPDSREFIEALAAPAAFVDSSNRLVLCNAAYAAAFGPPGEGAPGSDPVRAGLLDDCAAAVVGAPAGRAVCFEHRVHGDRGTRRFDVSVVPFAPGLGGVEGYFLVAAESDGPAADVLRRAEPAAALREGRERLRAEEELRLAKEDAERASRAKTRFLTATSHDLRQPLQALILMNSMLARQIRDPELRDLVGNMGSAIEAMKGALEGLLNIGRLEAGVVIPDLEDVCIADVVEAMTAEFSMACEAKGLGLRVVGCSALVRSDRELLGRIVNNLVSNAIKFTESGRVLIGCRRRGATVRLEVWDTGIGIPEDGLARIFDEFYRHDESGPERNRGLGLGLAIVQRMAGLLGHTVEVRSIPGAGSVFRVDMPLAAEAADEGGSADGGFASDGLAGKSVLLVEDDPRVAASTRVLLERWGTRVVWAKCGAEAMSLVSSGEHRPDLVIADYRLPGGDTGIDVVGRIAEAVEFSTAGLVVSGDTSPGVVDEARDAGVRLLSKPVEPAKLRALIHHLLRSPA